MLNTTRKLFPLAATAFMGHITKSHADNSNNTRTTSKTTHVYQPFDTTTIKKLYDTSIATPPPTFPNFSRLSTLAQTAEHSDIRQAVETFNKRPNQDTHPEKLSIGNLDAPSILDGLRAPYSPTIGLPKAKVALHAFLQTIGFDIDHISPDKHMALTTGGTEALKLAMRLTVNRGSTESVGVLSPSYTNTITIAKDELGLQINAIPFEFDANETIFSLPSIENVRNFVKEKNIKTLIIEPLSNPTGVVADEEYIKACLDIMDQAGGWLVLDVAYGGMTMDDSIPFTSGFSFLKENPDAPIIIAFTLSKSGIYCGGRIGGLGGHEEVIEAAAKLASSNLGPNILAQYNLITMYENNDMNNIKQVFDTQQEEYRHMAKTFVSELNNQGIELKASTPKGAIYIVCHSNHPDFNSKEFANFCAQTGSIPYDSIGYPSQHGKEKGTVLVAPMPGFYFGSETTLGDKQFRLSLIPGTDMKLTARLLGKLFETYLEQSKRANA